MVCNGAVLYLAEKGLARKTHIEHACPVQQLRAQFLLGPFPHLARSLRQRHIAGAFRICKPINAGATRMAAPAMRRSEMIESGNGKAAPGQLDGGETTHRPEADNGRIVVLGHPSGSPVAAVPRTMGAATPGCTVLIA